MKQDMAARSANRSLTSKAVTYRGLGGYEVIEFVERTVRAPAAGEVRIEVKAAAVNPADILFRDPGWPNMTSNIVPGLDAAGVIESVGPGVSRLHPGQKVIAAVNPVRPEGGAQAQHIVVPAASVVPIPEGVSLAQASILLMTGLTALNAREIAGLKKGQILAVSGGAGLLAQYSSAELASPRRSAGSCPMASTRCSTRRPLGKSPLVPSVTGASTFRFAAGETSPPNGESRSSRCRYPVSSNVPNGSNCSATWLHSGR